MPRDTPNRWEGTHTYKKPEAEKKRARTVAQLREEAAAKSKAGREEAINRRRGSICTPTTDLAAGASGRRGSTGGILTTRKGNSSEESNMPGSNKKGRNPSGGGAGSESGDGINPALKEFLIAMKEDIVQSNKDSMGRIEARLDKNDKAMEALEKRVELTECAIGPKIAAEVAKQCGHMLENISKAANKVGGAGKSSPRREEAYQLARRTLKIWPVKGDDLTDAVQQFFKERLRMDDRKIASLGSIAVMSGSGRLAKEKNEVTATFDSREDRDYVKAQGSNLAGQNEAGLAIHVPGHLLDNLAALNGLAYLVKQKNRGLKRAVKFDDAVQGLYLDMCIVGNWRKVTPEQAKLALKNMPSTGGDSGTLDASVLAELIQGRDVPGLTVAVVPEEGMED